ncbi:secretory pathway protein Sec39 [Schizosaccharomyces japonicus yFS275]|uniref:Secretory pathway protein Sec39 n=1 Tax=Schizosaccharomyces japonicus (strain yFS275 / FY16936) TaxID=402676 RepID=B6K878_SCHJY|nr:secretory pathway protein Sec39 [Schizosaccharomyces japonicus yFS275]EEB09732.1 secretory pathway protein Sec39 [Schizosaccharomyces japonicus yFS275]
METTKISCDELSVSQNLLYLVQCLVNGDIANARRLSQFLKLNFNTWLYLMNKYIPEVAPLKSYLGYLNEIDYNTALKEPVSFELQCSEVPMDELCQLRLKNLHLDNLDELQKPSDLSEFYISRASQIMSVTNLVELADSLTSNDDVPVTVSIWNKEKLGLLKKLRTYSSSDLKLEDLGQMSIRDIVSLCFPNMNTSNCVDIMDIIIKDAISSNSSKQEALAFVWEKLLQHTKTEGLEVIAHLLELWKVEEDIFRKLSQVAIASCYVWNDSTPETCSFIHDIVRCIEEHIPFDEDAFLMLDEEPQFQSKDLLKDDNKLTTSSPAAINYLLALTDVVGFCREFSVFPVPSVRIGLQMCFSNEDMQMTFLKRLITSNQHWSTKRSEADWSYLLLTMLEFQRRRVLFTKLSPDTLRLQVLYHMLILMKFSTIRTMTSMFEIEKLPTEGALRCMEDAFFHFYDKCNAASRNTAHTEAAASVLDTFREHKDLCERRQSLSALLKVFELLRELQAPSFVRDLRSEDTTKTDIHVLIPSLLKTHVKAYKALDNVLALGVELLKLRGEFQYENPLNQIQDLTLYVARLCIEASLQATDLVCAREYLNDHIEPLAEKSPKAKDLYWRTAYDIGKCPAITATAREVRSDMLQLAIAKAPKDMLPEIFDYWTQFEEENDTAANMKEKDIEDDYVDDFEWPVDEDDDDEPIYRNQPEKTNSSRHNNVRENIADKVTSTLTNGIGWVLGVPRE